MAPPPAHPPTDDLVELIAILLVWAVTSAAAFVIVIRDERRLDEQRLERAWPPVTRDWVLSGFIAGGPLLPAIGVWLHYIRTRRSFLGVLQGLGAAVLSLVPAVVLDLVFEAIFPES